jgi:fimbrial chaperone protein
MRLPIKVLILAITVFLQTILNALVLSPMEAEINISDKRKSATFMVSQSGDADVPVQVSLFERTIDINGKETRTPTKDFVFFPEQFVLKAGESRNIRLNYKGAEDIKDEKSYRLLVEQVPVELKPQKTAGKKVQVNFLLNFVASVYVQPKEVLPIPKVEAVRPLAGGKSVELTVVNEGNVHFLLKRITAIVLVDAAGVSKKINGNDIKALASENILAKGKRKVVLDVPAGFAPQKATIEWIKDPSA